MMNRSRVSAAVTPSEVNRSAKSSSVISGRHPSRQVEIQDAAGAMGARRIGGHRVPPQWPPQGARSDL